MTRPTTQIGIEIHKGIEAVREGHEVEILYTSSLSFELAKQAAQTIHVYALRHWNKVTFVQEDDSRFTITPHPEMGKTK